MRASAAAEYLRALEAEIDASPEFVAQTIFFGGGTPNTYPPETLAALILRLCERFETPPDAEISIECNPDLALCEGFDAYRRAGVSRLSLGVQSFDAAELQTLGRRHAPGDVTEVVRRARGAGFENLSLDLIFAVPGQTLESWRRTLDAALALDPNHVSTYGLTVELGTPYAGWQQREPGAFPAQELEADLYGAAIERLGAAGYEHYEISNFARPGFRSAHNANYWANGAYVGLGVGAASYLAGLRGTHTRDLAAYTEAALRGAPIPGELERLEGAARAGEAAMLALRTVEGVELASFAERYGIDFLSFYSVPVREMSEAGMLEVTTNYVRLSRRGRFLANAVCAAFLAAAD
jgi:oxygen-independent coproporphyrinogen-3 oxidase